MNLPLPHRVVLTTLAADTAAGCPLFAGKQVASAGWCSAWVKKA